MKTTRRFIAGFSAMAMAAAMAMSASAAEINQDSDPLQGSSKVTYNVDAAYTVTIPTTVTLSDTDDVTASVSASDVRLAQGDKIVVSLADTNDFKVYNGDASVTYEVSNTAGALAAGGTVKEFTEDGSEKLTFAKINKDDVQYAGTYTGPLVFDIAVEKSVPKIATGVLWKIGDELDFGDGVYVKSDWAGARVVSGVNKLHHAVMTDYGHYYCYFDGFGEDYNMDNDGRGSERVYGFEIKGNGTESDPYYCAIYHEPID